MQRMLTAREVAAMLRVTPKTIAAWIRQGQIRAVRFGRLWRIPAEEVEMALQEGLIPLVDRLLPRDEANIRQALREFRQERYFFLTMDITVANSVWTALDLCKDDPRRA